MPERFYLLPESRGVVAVAGADRRAFLQGLVSNDVTKVTVDRAIHAALLTAQGRYLHDFFIAEIGDRLLLDAEAERREDLRRRLSIYKLRSKVVLADATGELAVALLFGKDAAAGFELADEPGRATPWQGGVVYVDPRLAALGLRALLPRNEAAARLAAAGFTPAKPEDYEWLRLSLGVPDGSRDLPVEKAILLENGFDELNGVDWNKGCYMGQELTARTRYRGLVRKHLVPVEIDGPLPSPGTPIMLGDKEAGEMRSGIDGLGLALMRDEYLEAAERATQGRGAFAAGQSRLTPRKPLRT
jgi:folate-binding protein YgfZ